MFKKAIPVITVLFIGLIAGLLFGYACSVNLGLHNLTDEAYLKAMQQINIEIQNPVFLSVFMGVLILLPLSAGVSYSSGRRRFYLWLGATLIYFAGVFGVTILGNVPLNDELAKLDISSMNTQALNTFRMHFETSWGKYHMLRTVLSVLSFLLSVIASVRR